MDPHSFYADRDPAVFLNADPDPAVFLNADPDPAVFLNACPGPAKPNLKRKKSLRVFLSGKKQGW